MLKKKTERDQRNIERDSVRKIHLSLHPERLGDDLGCQLFFFFFCEEKKTWRVGRFERAEMPRIPKENLRL
jgi:hypothetical protein